MTAIGKSRRTIAAAAAVLGGILAAAAAAAWLTLRASLPDHRRLRDIARPRGARLDRARCRGRADHHGASSRDDLARALGYVHGQDRYLPDGPDAPRRGRRTVRAARARTACRPIGNFGCIDSATSRAQPSRALDAPAARAARRLCRRRQCGTRLACAAGRSNTGCCDSRPRALERRRQRPVRACHVPAAAGSGRSRAAAARLAARDAAACVVAISGSRRARVGRGDRRQPRRRTAAADGADEFDLRALQGPARTAAGRMPCGISNFSAATTGRSPDREPRTAPRCSRTTCISSSGFPSSGTAHAWCRSGPARHRFDVTGVTLPGTPAIVAGSNGRIAWGFTNSYGEFATVIRLVPVAGDSAAYATATGPQRVQHRR